jgi:class 3 adenylate cyclase/predicted ATPase
MERTTRWLAEIGLPEYTPIFIENDLEFDLLCELTDQDLKELGVTSLGHRRRMMRAIAELKSSGSLAVGTPSAPPLEPSRENDAERRQLTLLFCDLVGSTALAGRLDPEDMRTVIRAYQQACARVVTSYDGFLAKYMGDGILVYFGYPRAHEDDAERAVRCGLDIVAAVAGLQTRVGGALEARVGIATGTVVVGDLIGKGAAQEQAVVGGTPNLAARLQALAEPGSVVVGNSTRNLLGELFRLRDLGRHKLHGFAEPVAAWCVEGASSSESRFEAVRSSRLTAFIGREPEMAMLHDRKVQAWSGRGQVVLLSGEAGIGKSRITARFGERLAAESYTRLRYQCSPYHRDSALHPFIGQLQRAANLKPGDSPEQHLDRLEALLGIAIQEVAPVVPLFAALLSIPLAGRYPPLALSPVQQRRRTLAALLDQLEGLARQQPVLLLFEDVHWADATSIELLDLAVERIRHLPVFAIFTFRPEFEPPWTGLPNVSAIPLGRLDRRQVVAMVDHVAGGRKLPAEVVEQITAKTDGIPLFVEELTKTVLESGLLVEADGEYRLDGPLPTLAIPATLQDSLMARLDRLAPVKEVAQVGAAIGREFPYALAHAVVGGDQAVLDRALAQLETAELIFQRGASAEATYVFKHALVQEAAYESLLKSRRQLLHRRIAEALRDRFPARSEAEPEVVAHHFTEGGVPDAAVEWWGKAGSLALRRSAYVEAVSHLTKATGLASELPDGPALRVVRLRLQIAYASAHLHARGPSAPEPTAAFARAREIASGIAEAPERLSAYYGLWVSHYMRGELAPAREVTESMLRDFESPSGSQDASLIDRAIGMTRHAAGEYLDARRHLENSIASYSPERDQTSAFRFGVDTGVASMCFLALVVWPLGEANVPRRLSEEAIALALRIKHVPTMAYAHGTMAMLDAMRRDSAAALSHASATLDWSREHGMPLYQAMGSFFHGCGRWQAGERDSGLIEMREGARLLRGQGRPSFLPFALALLADAEAEAGRFVEAFAAIDDALAEVEETGQAACAAEVYRVRGEILLRDGVPDLAGAELAFNKAVAVGRLQRTIVFELSAALSLARLLLATGRQGLVRDLLEPALIGFSSGTDNPKVTEAKRLLASMS